MTTIEWTDESWNPLVGCSKVNEGCRNCYAASFVRRFAGAGQRWEGLAKHTPAGDNWTGVVRTVPEALGKPLRWKKPRMIFTTSISDPFHPAVPFDYLAAIVGIMALTPHHTHQPLTKQIERALEFFAWIDRMAERVRDVFPDETLNWRRWHILRAAAIRHLGTSDLPSIPGEDPPWPLPNVWVGVSIPNQDVADQCIAPAREIANQGWLVWVSHEPALGLVDWAPWMKFLRWVVCGGESGPKARPMHPDWPRSLRDQARAAGIPYFFKQWGEWAPAYYGAQDWEPDESTRHHYFEPPHQPCKVWRIGKKRAGAILDGELIQQWPEVTKS